MKLSGRKSKNIEDMRSPAANVMNDNYVDRQGSWFPPYPDRPVEAKGPFRKMVEGIKPKTEKRSRIKRK